MPGNREAPSKEETRLSEEDNWWRVEEDANFDCSADSRNIAWKILIRNDHVCDH